MNRVLSLQLQLRLWLTFLKRSELGLRIRAGRARNAFIGQVAKTYDDNSARTGLATLAANHERRLRGILADHYRKVILAAAKNARKQIKSAKGDRRFEIKQSSTLFERLIEEWMQSQGLKRARSIAETDRDAVLKAINEGLEEQEGTAAISRRIRKASQLTPFRAAMIARTETHNAATFASKESAADAERELEVRLVKFWLPTRDDRTRPEHLAMTGHPPIPLDALFDVGGEPMDRPGDPAGSAENTIACRCALAYQEAE